MFSPSFVALLCRPPFHLPEHPEQLLPHVPREFHPAVAQAVPLAEVPPVPAPGPRLVRPHQHDVVAHAPLVFRAQRLRRRPPAVAVAVSLPLPRRPVPGVHPFDAQHRRDGGHLVDAPEPSSREHRPRELRLHGKRRHLAAEIGHRAVLVDGAERVQLSQRVSHRLHVRFIEKVKVEDVQALDAERLEVEHGSHERRSLNLRYRRRRHVQLEVLAGVQTEAPPGSRAPRATRALPRLHRADGRHLQGVHPGRRVVLVLLGKARVNDEDHAGDGERRLREVGRDDDAPAPRGRGREDPRLKLRRERRVQGQDLHVRALVLGHLAHPLVQSPARSLNLLLARQEEQDVAPALRAVQVHHRLERRLRVVLGLLRGVRQLHGVHATRDVVDGTVVKVRAELFRFKRRRRDHQAKRGLPGLDEHLEQAEEDVGVERPLVRLV